MVSPGESKLVQHEQNVIGTRERPQGRESFQQIHLVFRDVVLAMQFFILHELLPNITSAAPCEVAKDYVAGHH